MLWNLCVFALLATQALSSSRYFIGTFQGAYKWAYPIDMCSLTGLLSYGYVKYTCSTDGSTVTQQTFAVSDPTCATPVSTTNYTSSSMLTNGLYAFSCDGTNDYVQSKLFVGSCSGTTTATIYSAINACFQISAYNNSYALYEQSQCNASMSQIGIYAAPYQTCDTSGYAALESSSAVTTTCALYITSPVAVYAKLLDCVYDGYSNFPVMMDNSGSITGTKTGVTGVELVINAWALDDFFNDPMVCDLDWFGWLSTYFAGSLVQTSSMCNSHEGSGYPSIVVDTDITYYNASWVENCLTIETNLAYSLGNLTNSTNIGVNITCLEYNITTTAAATTSTAATTTKKSPGAMVSINYLIVFAISCFVAMYI